MDSIRFDAITRRLGAAGTRRQGLAALVAGVAVQMIPGPGVEEAEASCKGYKRRCKKKRHCCKQDGLRCKRGRCRCKKGWKHCPGTGDDCTRVKADANHCGTCGNACPPETPCCINGSCQELCGGSCCADCFMDFLDGETPQPGTATCCDPGAGTFCKGNKHDPADDECCWPDQECVDGHCCSDGFQGAVICGGTCCAEASCCNGKCCPEGQVCATVNGEQACVSASRPCTVSAECHTGESCVGGICCSGGRVCDDVCCPSGEYCDNTPPEDDPECCAINTECNGTWRGRRVRR